MRNDTTALVNALTQLEMSVGLASNSMAQSDERLAAVFKTAAIKAFEYCYALSLKGIERRLADRMPPEQVEGFTFRSLMRAAWEHGLVANAENWSIYRDMRNATAHTYDLAKAAEIYSNLPRFIADVQQLLLALKAHADVS